MEYTNVFYFYNIGALGGIETFFYQLAKKYYENDITIIYRTGDVEQIKRLKKYVRVVRYKEEKIRCKKMFFNYTMDIIDNVEAEEYVQIIHSDFKTIDTKPNVHPKITKYISVSDIAGKSFEEITKLKTKTIYNPIAIEEPRRVLFLISATRLSSNKGENRMIKLADILDKANIPYLWLVFTNNKKTISNPNFIYMKPRLDIMEYIAKADYLVQLSDGEAYCYSLVEALMLSTPVITTDIPVLKEIGVNESNGIILDFDLSNVDTQEIYNKKFNFKYEPPKSNWGEEIIKSKSTYKEEKDMRFKVEALKTWKERNITCNDLGGRIPNEGEQWEVDKERLEVLLGDNSYGLPFVKLISEVKETPIELTEEGKKIIDEIKEEKAIEVDSPRRNNITGELSKGTTIKVKETSKKESTKKTTTKKPVKKK